MVTSERKDNSDNTQEASPSDRLSGVFLRATLERSQVPASLHNGLIRYVAHGVPPGTFLCYVLSNDVRGAWWRASDENRQHMGAIVQWVIQYVPLEAWGSEAVVEQWLEVHKRGYDSVAGSKAPEVREP